MSDLVPQDHAEAIALFRSEIVGSLTRRELDRGELAQALAELSQQRFRPPDAKSTKSYSVATLERWYYAYHVEERFADQLAGIAEMLRLPAGHVIALDGSLSAQAQRSRMPGHGSSIHDAVYLPVWERMLGRGDSAP